MQAVAGLQGQVRGLMVELKEAQAEVEGVNSLLQQERQVSTGKTWSRVNKGPLREDETREAGNNIYKPEIGGSRGQAGV
jgi:hypothetical protein